MYVLVIVDGFDGLLLRPGPRGDDPPRGRVVVLFLGEVGAGLVGVLLEAGEGLEEDEALVEELGAHGVEGSAEGEAEGGVVLHEEFLRLLLGLGRLLLPDSGGGGKERRHAAVGVVGLVVVVVVANGGRAVGVEDDAGEVREAGDAAVDVGEVVRAEEGRDVVDVGRVGLEGDVGRVEVGALLHRVEEDVEGRLEEGFRERREDRFAPGGLVPEGGDQG
mmetsp:Transcript_37181/g.119290  ORF Transcript_37181/g.119290 Transcript_37181/m.119290 type:complete len:219 (+) Transcript_37181:692-1348(+)